MNFSWEKEAWGKGKDVVFGLDEAGRGPLAGPVTAAAVMVRQFPIYCFADGRRNFQFPKAMREVNDSKKLSVQKREKLYEALTSSSYIFSAVSWVTPQVIDRLNILGATKRAMRMAVARLEAKIGRRAELLLIDGNFSINAGAKERSVKKGDQKIFSCAAASIIAKVFRDQTMRRYHKVFSKYGFDRHKGYSTKLHREALREHGLCRIHRKSFRLVY